MWFRNLNCEKVKNRANVQKCAVCFILCDKEFVFFVKVALICMIFWTTRWHNAAFFTHK